MTDYQFPVKIHRFTTEEFDKQKADYTAKYGYTIHIPGITDIIKLGRIPEPTEEELKAYKRKDHSGITEERYQKIKELKAAKKKSFLNMMSSPNPTWLNNIGTIMTFLDDVNDSLGTAAVILRAGASLLPKALAKFMLGPAGWLWSMADMVGFISTVLQSPLSKATCKHGIKVVSTANPMAKETKIRKAKWLNRVIPSKGEIIEGLQTTNNVLGVGLSLGPILGALLEAITGPVRVLQGHEVKVDWPIRMPTTWEASQILGLQAVHMLMTGSDELPDEDHMKASLAGTMAIKALWPYFQDNHPMEKIHGLEHIILTPPKLKSLLSREILLEEGINPDDHVGFLHAEGSDNTVRDLATIGAERIPAQAMKVCDNMKHDVTGWIMAECMADTAVNGLALLEGEDNVEIEFNPVAKALFTITDADYKFLREPTEAQRNCFVNAVTNLAPDPYNITFRDLQYLLSTRCGISFVRRPKPPPPPTPHDVPWVKEVFVGDL